MLVIKNKLIIFSDFIPLNNLYLISNNGSANTTVKIRTNNINIIKDINIDVSP